MFKKKKALPPVAKEAAPVKPACATATVEDTEEIAVITAAIHAFHGGGNPKIGKPGIVVRNITRIGDTSTNWNRPVAE